MSRQQQEFEAKRDAWQREQEVLAAQSAASQDLIANPAEFHDVEPHGEPPISEVAEAAVDFSAPAHLDGEQPTHDEHDASPMVAESPSAAGVQHTQQMQDWSAEFSADDNISAADPIAPHAENEDPAVDPSMTIPTGMAAFTEVASESSQGDDFPSSEDEANEVDFESPSMTMPVSASDVLAKMGHENAWQDGIDGETAAANDPALQDDGIQPSFSAGEAPAEAQIDPVVEPAAGGGDSEESIEDYMARLLQRVRGSDEDPASISAGTPAKEPAATISPNTADKSAEEAADNSENETQDPDEPAAEYTPRKQAPELSSNMDALRELANESARAAIDSSVRRRSGATAAGRFVVAIVAAVIGCALLYLRSSLHESTIYGAVLILFVAVVYGVQGIVLKRRTNGSRKPKRDVAEVVEASGEQQTEATAD